MQRPFANSTVQNPDLVSSSRRLSIIALVGIITAIMIILALVGMRYDDGHFAARNSLSSGEFSSGMPLP